MSTRLVTDLGVADVVAALVAANTPFLGWGGGTGQEESDTDLASPFAESRVSGGASVATTNTPGDTYRVTGTLNASTARAVKEVGVFAASSGAVMQVYGDFPTVSLAGGEGIAFTVDVVVDQACDDDEDE